MPADPASRLPILPGILCLCTGLAFFAMQDAIVKGLVDRYSVLQVLLVRSCVAGSCIGAFILVQRGLDGFRTRQPRLQGLRAGCVLGAFICFYAAMGRMGIAEVVALFSAAPLFITALSGSVLGESVGARRWAAVVLGFVGVMIMVAPGSSVFDPISLLALLAALCYSASALIARRLGPSEPSSLLALYSNAGFVLGCSIGLAALTTLGGPGAEQATNPLFRPYIAAPRTDLELMMLAGVVALAGFTLVPRAYQIAPASVISPFEYTYLLWAILIGYAVYGDVPSVRMLTGASLVIAAGVYIARR